MDFMDCVNLQLNNPVFCDKRLEQKRRVMKKDLYNGTERPNQGLIMSVQRDDLKIITRIPIVVKEEIGGC